MRKALSLPIDIGVSTVLGVNSLGSLHHDI
jgi:hypothetical protein